MTALEAVEFSYSNGIYAGDLFITKEGNHKQHDWNIRRSARAPSESLIIFGMPNYFSIIRLPMADFGRDRQLNNIEMFRVYNQICDCLVNEYGIYVTNTSFGYCGKGRWNDVLRFHVITHPKWLVDTEDNEQPLQHLPNSEHQHKMTELVRGIVEKILQKQ